LKPVSVVETVSWGDVRLEVTCHRWSRRHAGEQVTSVRAIVLSGDYVLVVTNDHEAHIIPVHVYRRVGGGAWL
jgi:hypothetical protein